MSDSMRRLCVNNVSNTERAPGCRHLYYLPQLLSGSGWFTTGTQGRSLVIGDRAGNWWRAGRGAAL